MAPTNVQQKGEKGTLFPPSTRLIVIGASAGGFEAIKTIVRDLPPEFAPPIFIVWHISAEGRGILPNVLNQAGAIYAAHAHDKEPIKENRIYVAPPDHHLLLEDHRVRITHGPKENRFRPAIDPLFRSAAYSYGRRMIGIILSGALDDGTAGLWTLKDYGGIAIIQDPKEAEFSSMPENALKNVAVDHCIPVARIPALLLRLSEEQLLENTATIKDEQTKKEIDIAAEASGMKKGRLTFDELSPFTCPECHGVLSRLRKDTMASYRCHTGHAYSVKALMEAQNEKIEENMYNALRAIDESILLLNHLGDNHAENNHPDLAALFFNKAKEMEKYSSEIRVAALRPIDLTFGKAVEEAGYSS